jgi:drug/metabolite transporter (DMT)-like permease
MEVPVIGALGTTFFFACNAIFANRSAQRLGSNPANLARLAVAVVLLGAWAHLAGHGLGGRSFSWFLLSGIAGFGLGGVAMFQALPRIGSPLAMLIVQCGSSLVAAAVEWGWLGTRLTTAQLAFVAATLTGVALGLMAPMLASDGAAPGGGDGSPTSPDRQSFKWPRTPRRGGPTSAAAGLGSMTPGSLRAGMVWAAISAFGQGLGAVLSRKAFRIAAQAHEATDPASTAYQRALGGLLVAAVVVAATWLWRRRAAPPLAREAGRAWPWVLANAVTGPVLGVTCFQWALSTTPAGIVQPIVATAPLLTIPLAMWFEHARPRPLYYLGAILAVLGVVGLFTFR